MGRGGCDTQSKPPRPQPTPAVRTATASDRFATPIYRAAIESYIAEIAIDSQETPARSTEIDSYITEMTARSKEIAIYTTEMAVYMTEMATYTTEMAVYASEIAIYTMEMAGYSVEMTIYVKEISSYTDENDVATTVYVTSIAPMAGFVESTNRHIQSPLLDDNVARSDRKTTTALACIGCSYRVFETLSKSVAPARFASNCRGWEKWTSRLPRSRSKSKACW